MLRICVGQADTGRRRVPHPQNFFFPWLITSPMMLPLCPPRPAPPVLLRFMMELGWRALGYSEGQEHSGSGGTTTNTLTQRPVSGEPVSGEVSQLRPATTHCLKVQHNAKVGCYVSNAIVPMHRHRKCVTDQSANERPHNGSPKVGTHCEASKSSRVDV